MTDSIDIYNNVNLEKVKYYIDNAKNKYYISGKYIKNNFPDIYSFILNYTSFFKNLNWTDRLFCIRNNIKEKYCIVCGKPLRNPIISYCSSKCSNNDPLIIKKKVENHIKTFNSKSEIEKNLIKQKRLKTWNSKSIEERELINQKRSLSHRNRTKEQIEESNEKNKLTKLERYGDRHYNNLNKMKETCLERYGRDNFFKTDEFQIKKKETCLERYGNEIFTRTELYKEKSKNTNLERYGYDSPNKSIIVKEKQRKGCLDHFGYDSPMKNPESITKHFENRMKNGTLFTSKGENELRKYIESLGLKTEKRITGSGDTRVEIDIFIRELNIGIEFNGVWWHSKNHGTPSNYHYNKSKKCLDDNNIEIIHVFEDLWINKQNIIKNIIKHRLGFSENRIYARKCIVKEIDNEVYKDFCNKNHIQGFRAAKIKLGLFYNDELVQIASFDRVRGLGKAKKLNELYDYEWIRGCPASNNNVVGGTTKLFSYFIKNYNPKSVLCYADWNLFNGKGYRECGFEFKGYTGPNKFYVIANKNIRINRNPYKYREYKELVETNKLLEIYGAGSLKFVWRNIDL